MAGFALEYLQLSGRIEAFMSGGGGEFEDLAFEVFEFQLRHNEGYARFCDGKSFDDWKSIPAVPTAAFKVADRPVTCFPAGEAERFFETSGTTGETRGRHYFRSCALYQRAIDLGFAGSGRHDGTPICQLSRAKRIDGFAHSPCLVHLNQHCVAGPVCDRFTDKVSLRD